MVEKSQLTTSLLIRVAAGPQFQITASADLQKSKKVKVGSKGDGEYVTLTGVEARFSLADFSTQTTELLGDKFRERQGRC